MTITVTSLRLRTLWQFFALSLNALHIIRQTQKQGGFIAMKSRGFGYLHYTMSVWENEASMKAFARSGAHREAMKQSQKIAREIRTYTFQGDRLPSWAEAKHLLGEKGKVLAFR